MEQLWQKQLLTGLASLKSWLERCSYERLLALGQQASAINWNKMQVELIFTTVPLSSTLWMHDTGPGAHQALAQTTGVVTP